MKLIFSDQDSHILNEIMSNSEFEPMERVSITDNPMFKQDEDSNSDSVRQSWSLSSVFKALSNRISNVFRRSGN